MKIEDMQEPGNLAQAKRLWEDLFENSAWLSLVEALQAQTDSLQRDILFGEVRTAEDLYLIERKKGQLEGRLSVTATATAMFETLQTDLQQALKENTDAPT